MDTRLTGSDYSLNAGLKGEDETEWQDWLEDERKNQEDVYAEEDEHKKRLSLLLEAMKDLRPKEYDVIKYRRLAEPPRTLEEIAVSLNLSKERIRQIENQAMERLHKSVANKAREINLHM